MGHHVHLIKMDLWYIGIWMDVDVFLEDEGDGDSGSIR